MSITVDLSDLKDSILKDLKSELLALLKPANPIRISSIADIGDESRLNGTTGVSEEVSQTIEEIHSEIKTIKEELVGPVIKQEKFEEEEANCVNFGSNATLKQTLNNVLLEVKSLKQEVDELKLAVVGEGICGSKDSVVCKSKRPTLNCVLEPPKKLIKIDFAETEIITNEEYEGSLNQEICRLVNNVGLGKEDGRMDNVNTVSLVKESREFYCVGVQITNLTDAALVDGDTCRNGTGTDELVPSVILAGSKESFLVKNSGPGNEKLEGLISYVMEKSDFRLVIYYYVYSSENKVGIAVCPSSIPVSKELLKYMQTSEHVDRTRPDKQCDRSRVVVMLKNVIARAVMTWGNRSVLTVEIVKNDSKTKTENALELSFEEKWFRSLVDGKTLVRCSLNNMMASVKKQFGCGIMFCNGLGLPMTELSWEIRSDMRKFLVPAIMPKTREAFVTSDDLNMQGIFSYRVGSSDLRLALVFQVFNGGCKFAVAFVPFDVPSDFSLMKSMINTKEWSSRPDRKFSQACHGEQVVEVRNLRAKVSMTNGPRAIMTVMISTL